MPDTKECSRCGEEKPLSEFHKDCTKSDGYKTRCKICRRAITRERRKRLKEQGPTKDRDEKTCCSCEQTKDASEFYRDVSSADYLDSFCKDCRKEQTREWEQNNPERVRKRNREWQRENRGKMNAWLAENRAKRRRAKPDWADRDRIMDKYKKAQWLTQVTGVEHHVDHIDPIIHDKVCGLHVASNLQILTKEDNGAKGNDFNLGTGNKHLAERGVDYASS